jgi:hypothetical protein
MTTIIPIIIPVDSSPTKFAKSFQTKSGVCVDVTVYTKSQGVADSIVARLERDMGWTEVSSSSKVPLWAIPLLTVTGLVALGFVVMLSAMMLDAANWLPHIKTGVSFNESIYMDGFDELM